MDLWAYFRFTSLSVLMGLGMFFFSYATLAWRRRQKKNHTSGQTGVLQFFGRSSRVLLVVGIGLALVGYIIGQVVPIRGIMRLNESFASRARLDHQITYLAPRGPIEEGEVLTRFAPSNFHSELTALKAKHEQLAAELEKTRVSPLEIDEELTRGHQNVLSDVEQAQVALNNLVPLVKETVRIGLEKHLERREKLTTISRYIIDYEATRNQSQSKYEYQLKNYQRSSKLLDKEAIARSDFELTRHETESSAEQIRKLEKTIQHFHHEIDQLKNSNKEFDQLIAQQAAFLQEKIQQFEDKKQRAEKQLAEVESAIETDTRRARQQKAAEMRMISAEMNEIQANISSLKEANTILAPHDGVVAYRSAAPNSVEEHGVVLVMAESRSAEVQFTLPKDLLNDLSNSDSLEIWVEDSVLTTRLTGEISESKDSPFHSGQAIVSAECEPPMDLLPLLANEQLVPVQLTWHPPLLTVPVFQLSLGLIALGALGTLLSVLGRPLGENECQQPFSESPEDSPASLLEEDRHGVHKDAVGTSLRILGNRLRESIFVRQVDQNLVASVEDAIDRHQHHGVKMIRQGMVETLTENEDLPVKLDAALNDFEAHGPIDEELYQRLVALLRILQIDSIAQSSALPSMAH